MKTKIITDATFNIEVLKSPTLTIVDFWAEWCGPCKQLAPVLDALAAAYEGKVKFVKLDTDEHPEASKRYRVTSLPTLMFFKDGAVVAQIMGCVPRKKIEDEIKRIKP